MYFLDYFLLYFWNIPHTHQWRGASHCGLAIYIKKDLKAKEEEL